MKYLVISDIHGFSFYAKKIEDIYTREKPEKIILLGDLYYSAKNTLTEEHNPIEVAKILNKYKDIILCTKGNCDTQADKRISSFEFKDYIELTINGVKFFFSHGHIYNKEHIPPVGQVVVYGHFHTGFIIKENGIIFANPGSISLPRKHTKHSYLVIDDDELILKDVDGNNIVSSSFL